MAHKDDRNVVKGGWSKEEDEKLVQLVDTFVCSFFPPNGIMGSLTFFSPVPVDQMKLRPDAISCPFH